MVATNILLESILYAVNTLHTNQCLMTLITKKQLHVGISPKCNPRIMIFNLTVLRKVLRSKTN